MTFGFDADLSSWSPFHGAYYAVAQSLAKITTLGGDPRKAYLTFQEYFERLTTAQKWGKPTAALLGAFKAQLDFGVAAIGGKDSMSGSFMDLHVPPTLVSFAVAVESAGKVLSASLKSPTRPWFCCRCRWMSSTCHRLANTWLISIWSGTSIWLAISLPPQQSKAAAWLWPCARCALAST